MEPYLSDALLILQLVLLFVVVRTYYLVPSFTSGLLLAALICYAIAGSSWFTVFFAAGLLSDAADAADAQRQLESVRHYMNVAFQIVFVLLMIAALRAYKEQSRASGTPSI